MEPNPPPSPPPKDKKGSAPEDKVCANCLAPQSNVAKLSACTRCGLVAYCSKDCQRAHWKANHKQFCIAKADRAPPPQATAPDKPPDKASVARKGSAVRAVAAGEECAICLDPLTAASALTLPCGHVFHAACVAEVRKFGVKQVCPMCRTELPPGPEKVHEEALQRYILIRRRVQRGEASWGALTKADQQEMNDVIRMWRDAAEQGCAEAQLNLGKLFIFGYGVKLDDSEAFEWFLKAADQGFAEAQCCLGTMRAQGKSGKQDYSEAFKWYRKAGDQGCTEAQYNLGGMYGHGLSVKQDYSEAVKWYRKAADQGYAKAQYNLGLFYGHGKGVKKDYSEAFNWYRKAADQGYANAQSQLGVLYAHGIGVKQDYSKAFKWYRKAADQGYDETRFDLGACYEHGLGVRQSRSKAIEQYALAGSQGHEKAKQKLAVLLSADPLLGTRVQLQGLKAKPEMNGAKGVVQSFNEATGRYAVQLDSGGPPFMLKAANFKELL